MNVASPSSHPSSYRGAPSAALVRAAIALIGVIASLPAMGQGEEDETGPGFLTVLAHLDALTIGLILFALLVVALFVWRIARMVRRETPVALPARRTAASPLERNDSLVRTTDWGFDQNKRAALARSPVTVPNTTVDLPSLEHAVTQWSITDVQRANDAGVQTEDSLGKSPAAANSLYRTSFNPYFRRETPAAMDVVEVADALLQAELLVQLGDPKQAMSLLSQHIRDTEKPGPAVWVMLLGLYQSTGREAQYNALGAGFKVLFNAEVPPWATSPDVLSRDLESYETVVARIQAAWGGPDARGTLEKLLNDDRGGSRLGFSLPAYRDLIFLGDILDALDALKIDEDERSGIQRKLGTIA